MQRRDRPCRNGTSECMGPEWRTVCGGGVGVGWRLGWWCIRRIVFVVVHVVKTYWAISNMMLFSGYWTSHGSYESVQSISCEHVYPEEVFHVNTSTQRKCISSHGLSLVLSFAGLGDSQVTGQVCSWSEGGLPALCQFVLAWRPSNAALAHSSCTWPVVKAAGPMPGR